MLALRRSGRTPVALPLASRIIAGIMVDFFLRCCEDRPLLILWQPEPQSGLGRRQRAAQVLTRLSQAGVPVIADGWLGSIDDENRANNLPGLWGVRLATNLLPEARRTEGRGALLTAIDSARYHRLQTMVADVSDVDRPVLQRCEVDWSSPPAAEPPALPAIYQPVAA